MKKGMTKKLTFLCTVVFLLAAMSQVAFAEASAAPVDTTITVTNNFTGNPDTVSVTSLTAGDIIKVYSGLLSTTPIGTAQADTTSATAYIDQVGAKAGKLYVTVVGTGKTESPRTAKTYIAEPVTATIVDTTVTVTNNPVGSLDSIEVTGLAPNDIVKVYSGKLGGKPIGCGIADSEGSATVLVYQINKNAGKVYVTNTTAKKAESLRVEKAYTSETTGAPALSTIKVTNNKSGTDDTVVVSSLTAGDIVKVYSAATGGTELGNATVASEQTSATITIEQLGAKAGKVYVTVKKTGKNESPRAIAPFTSETSIAPKATNIVVTNNFEGTSDTVAVSGLLANDVVTVYDASTGGTTLGTATVASDGTSATVTIAQIGAKAASVYVSTTSTNKLESLRTAKAYIVEPTTGTPTTSNITVTNNKVSVSDTVVVTGLVPTDVVKVYSAATGGTAIGTATVATGETTATVTIAQIGAAAGKVYVSTTSTGKVESARIAVSYASETSAPTTATKITVVNNYVGTQDTIAVTGLKEGDVVKVYSVSTGGTAIGTSDAVGAGATTTTISVDQLSIIAGKVYVSVTSTNKLESLRVYKAYVAEKTAVTAGNITVTNNTVGTKDTVAVTGLAAGDIVKVYSASTAGTTLGTATVATSATEATVSITQLGTTSGKVYVTVKNSTRLESDRVEKSYTAETAGASAAPSDTAITVTNNVGSSDSIVVTGLTSGDVVKVYSASTAGTQLGTATATGASVTITADLGTTGTGSVFVTVTSTGKTESTPRTEKAFIAEPV